MEHQETSIDSFGHLRKVAIRNEADSLRTLRREAAVH